MHVAGLSCRVMKTEQELHPQHVLLEAWHMLSQSSLVGSSTACLVSLHPHKAELRAANVGDSGFIIVRRLIAPGQPEGVMGTLDALGSIDALAAASSSARHSYQARATCHLRTPLPPLGRAHACRPAVCCTGR